MNREEWSGQGLVAPNDGPPLTPVQIGRWLGEITHQIGKLVDELGEADLDLTRKRAEARRAFAIAFRQASGSAEARKYTATEVCYGRQLAADEAACRVRDLNERIQHARDRIRVGQSYGAALRAEASAINTPWMEG
jgi:hypothetical protein